MSRSLPELPSSIRQSIRQSIHLALLAAVFASPSLSSAAAPGAPRAPLGHCVDGPTRLCLDGRFQVEATWRDESGRERAALAVALAPGATGVFSFADGENADLLVGMGEQQHGDGEIEVRAAALAGGDYHLQILDTVTGVAWSTDGVTEGSTPNPEVASVLDSANLLGGRFRARVISLGPDGRRSPARAVLGGGETSLFSTADRGAVDVAVRVVDGRAVNGHFWLAYGALTTAEVEIEIVDLATGNGRRFAKPVGSSGGALELEALSGSAAVVHVTLDDARAVTATLGPQGGALEASDANGTRFRLAVPKDALISTLNVTLTPVATIGVVNGSPFSAGVAGAVYLQPAGLVLNSSALLTVTPSPLLPRAQQLTFAFRGLAGELSLAPPLANQAALVLPVHRFGGYGVGAGTAADLTAQLGRLPTRAEDRLLQRLAGLLLPLRRAGTGGALPASVLQLLQQEYNAIKPKVAQLKLGKLEANYPIVRNWQNAAKDTGQTAKLPAQHQEIKSAEIAGAVKSYNSAATAAAATSFNVATRPCSNIAAAERMYRAYTTLRSRAAQGQVDSTRLQLCARLELKWDTTLDFTPPSAPQQHQEVEVRIPLSLNLAGGYFAGVRLVNVTKDEISDEARCNVYFSVAKTGNVVNSKLEVKKLFVSTFAWYDYEIGPLSRTVEVFYGIEPAASQEWILTCEQHHPPLPAIPRTSFPFITTWSGTYMLFHLQELDPGIGAFHTVLPKAANPQVLAQKEYAEISNEYFREDTFFQLFFGSAPN
ncbi:MAG: hypothetical protein ABI609_11745 [Acidobacteriota bacterium]